MSEAAAPSPKVVFLIDVAQTPLSPSSKQSHPAPLNNVTCAKFPQITAAAQRLISFYNDCSHCNLLWAYQFFDSNNYRVSLAPRRVQFLPVSFVSFRSFRDDLSERLSQSVPISTSFSDKYVAVARAVEDILRDAEWTSANESSPTDSFLDEHRQPPPLSQPLCSAGHSVTASLYLFAAAPHVAEALLPFDSSDAFPLMFSSERAAAAPTSGSSPYQRLSSLMTSLPKVQKAQSPSVFRRALGALQKRNVLFKWIDTGPICEVEQNCPIVSKSFAKWLASVSASTKLISLKFFSIDERVVSSMSLLQGLDERARVIYNSPRGRLQDARTKSNVEWVEVEVGVMGHSLLDKSEHNTLTFHRCFQAQLGITSCDFAIQSRHSDQTFSKPCASGPLRMVFRGFFPNAKDEKLDELGAFEDEASLLRPSDRAPPSTFSDLALWSSSFAGLMAKLALTQTSLIADVAGIENGHYVYSRSVLVRPITMSNANIRRIRIDCWQPLPHFEKELDIDAIPTKGGSLRCIAPNLAPLTLRTSAAVFQRFLHAPADEEGEKRLEETDRKQSIVAGLKELATLSFNECESNLFSQQLDTSRHSEKGLAVDSIIAAILRNETDDRRAVCQKNYTVLANDFERAEQQDSGAVTSTSHDEPTEMTACRRMRTSCVPGAVEVAGRTEAPMKNLLNQNPCDMYSSENRVQSNDLPAGSVLKHQSNSLVSLEQTPRSNKTGESNPNLSSFAVGESPNWPILQPLPPSTTPDPQPHVQNPTKVADTKIALRAKSSHVADGGEDGSILSSPVREEQPPSCEPTPSGVYKSHQSIPATELTSSFCGEVDGSAMLQRATIRLDHSVSELIGAHSCDIPHRVTVCLRRMSSIVEVIANVDHWRCIQNSFSAFIKKQSVLSSALRHAHKDSRISKHIPTLTPRPKFWAVIIDALVQVIWHIAEGANRYQTGTARIGPKRRKNLTDRAISILSCVQLAGETLSGTDGHTFYREVISSFFRDVVMRFSHGSHPESFIDAVKALFIEYDVDHSPFCVRPSCESAPGDNANREEVEAYITNIGGRTSAYEQSPDNRSECGSPHLRKRPSMCSGAMNNGGPPPKRACERKRDIKEMIAISRDKKLAVEQRRSQFSRHTLDVEKAKRFQKPLSLMRDKHRRQKNHQPHQGLLLSIGEKRMRRSHWNLSLHRGSQDTFSFENDNSDNRNSGPNKSTGTFTALTPEIDVVVPATPFH